MDDPGDDWSRDELLAAAASCRNQKFADLLLLTLGLVAETHPEELRKCLLDVIGLDDVARACRRSAAAARQAAQLADKALIAARRAERLMKDLEKLEARIDAVTYGIEQAERSTPKRRTPE